MVVRAELWELVDPRCVDPIAASLMQQILNLVRDDWVLSGQVDIDAPGAKSMLSDHRVWNLIPVEAVPAHQQPALRHRQLVLSAGQLRIMAVATEVLKILDDADIDTRVLKGLATAELDYPRRLLRQGGDVDLAVRPAQLDDAVRALRRVGYTDHVTPYSPYLMYGKTLKAPNGIEVDLHTRLFRRSPMSQRLFADPGVKLTDLPGTALGASERLAHAAGHFMVAPPGERRLSGLLDVTRILNHPEVCLSEARSFAADIGVEALVGAALQVEASLSERTDHLGELTEWKTPDWLERKTRLAPERRLVLEHLSRFREVQRRDWLRYLPTWLIPDQRQRDLLRHSISQRGGLSAWLTFRRDRGRE